MPDHLHDLRCVECGQTELLWQGRPGGAEESAIRCRACGHRFAYSDGVLRMVPQNSPLSQPATDVQSAVLNDAVQAQYWEDDSHGFRAPDHPIVKYFSTQRWRFLSKLCDLDGCKTALDVGCGDGFSTMYAPPHLDLTACDGSLTMLRRHRGGRRFQVDAFCLPFRDRTFDLVFCWELLHHVSEPHRVLTEMARVSRRFVICCEPNPLNPAQFAFSLYDPAHRWVLKFSSRYFRRQAEKAGLRVTSLVRGGCLFPNKTPGWLFPLLKFVPYRLPLIGISSCLVAEVGPNITTRAMHGRVA